MEEEKKGAEFSIPKIILPQTSFEDILNKAFQLLEEEKSPKLTSACFENPRFLDPAIDPCLNKTNKQ